MFKRLYFFEDIPTEEGKDKAREWYRDINDMPFLSDDIEEYITDELSQIG